MEQRMCSKCCRVSPIRDFMNPTSTVVLKSCIVCRQASRARGRKRRENKKSRLEAFNALQQHTPQLAEYLYNTASFSARPTAPSPLRQEVDSSRLGSESTYTTCTQMQGTTATACSQGSSHPSQSSDGDGESENPPPPISFVCICCEVTRSANLDYDGICVYCLERKQQYCIKGGHETDATKFQGEGGRRHLSCEECREGKMEVKVEVEVEDSGDDSESSESSEE